MNRRLPAEWESQSAIQFTFPHKNTDWRYNWDEAITCFVEIIQTVVEFQPVLLVCDDVALAKAYFKGKSLENIIFQEVPSNDTWARDYGPITIFENGKPMLLDFEFNGWGGKYNAKEDNLISGILYDRGIFQVDGIIKENLVLEGGSIESDGAGTLLTTSTCLLSPSRNPHLTKEALTEILKNTLGVERVMWLQHGYLKGDDTDGHIDTLARFCNQDTIAYVACNNQMDDHFEALQLMKKELASLITKKGKPYQLIPLPLPTPVFDENSNRLPATYANFLIINEAVLVPKYGVKEDGDAIDILSNVFKGRKVIAIKCRPLLHQYGSLHCLSMQFPEGVVKLEKLRNN